MIFTLYCDGQPRNQDFVKGGDGGLNAKVNISWFKQVS